MANKAFSTHSYPNADIVKESQGESSLERSPEALQDNKIQAVRISDVVEGSPAWEAGFEEGCYLLSLNGKVISDILDYRWRSADDEIELEYRDLDGETGVCVLYRDNYEDWGFRFENLIYDGVKLCRNACTFCFMHQLPRGLRKSLYLRDDDFRLSFLSGTFVTLTNLSKQDEERIIEQRISPLHVSLQAYDHEVRQKLIGKHEGRGIEALNNLLAHGIHVHAQIVLVPNENDGHVLVDTLTWAQQFPEILSVGIVPLGYTRFQSRFTRSFQEPKQAQAVLQLIEPFQQNALSSRNTPWVFAADEFYINAFGPRVIEKIPPAPFYGEFSLFEDGIGMLRSQIDEWHSMASNAARAVCARRLKEAKACAYLIAGCAQEAFFGQLLASSAVTSSVFPLYVKNEFFGGNVNVTGLLCGCDIVDAIRRTYVGHVSSKESQSIKPFFFIPKIVFNDDGLTLDDMSLEDIRQASGCFVHVVSLKAEEYFNEIARVL